VLLQLAGSHWLPPRAVFFPRQKPSATHSQLHSPTSHPLPHILVPPLVPATTTKPSLPPHLHQNRRTVARMSGRPSVFTSQVCSCACCFHYQTFHSLFDSWCLFLIFVLGEDRPPSTSHEDNALKLPLCKIIFLLHLAIITLQLDNGSLLTFNRIISQVRTLPDVPLP